MKFELTILGSGSAVPTLRRNSTAQVLNINEDFYLIDCAEGTQMQMRKYEIKMQRINYIFISHLHGDHYLGLPGYLQTLHLLGRLKPLTIFGPAELEILLLDHFKIARSTLRYEVFIVPIDSTKHQIIHEDDKVEVWSIPLKHKVETSGFLFKEKPRLRNIIGSSIAEYKIPLYWIQRIKEGEDYAMENGTIVSNSEITTDPIPVRSYAYCSDTMYSEEIVEWIKNVDLLYHEASFLEKMRSRAVETMHSTPMDAARIAKLANVKKLILGHLSARYKNVSGFLEEAAPIFKNVEVAEDGNVYSL